MEKLDTVRRYETPEGIVLRIRIAGPASRAYAWLIDSAIKIGIYIAFGMTLSFMGKAGFGIMMIVMFAVEWFYPVVFEVLRGATPGKKVLGLSVIHDNGTPVHFSSSMIRNLLRFVDFLPFLYGFGLAAVLINKDFKRLGDMAAGTLVVYEEEEKKLGTIFSVKPVQPPLDLMVNEQRTILDLAERSEFLSKDRCIELSEILWDIHHQRGEDALNVMVGYANWLSKGK